MSGIEDWLESLGLAELAPTFADAAIDLDILMEINEGDLEALGIPLGHRKRLMRAVTTLARPATPAASAKSVDPDAGDKQRLADQAERRQLTVMFCDLVDSTALSGRLDPEDMRKVIGAYQDACVGVIDRFEGFAAKFMGDGVLAYFGYPRAHEDDPERAVRAGLDLATKVATLQAPTAEPLACRVGIATGLVVVGDLVGVGAVQEQAVVGETPNLAARLQGLAQPGAVLVAPSTRRLLRGVFDLEDLGAQQLKGFTTPIRAWRVVGEGASESRFEAHRAPRLTPLVGRDDEVTILNRRWRRARQGEGQVVVITGEPGIGKSRLVANLQQEVADEPHIRLTYQCSPHHTESALHPVIRQLEHAAGIRLEQGSAEKLDRLEALLCSSSDASGAHVPLLASLLSIPGEAASDLGAQGQKERTFRALLQHLEGLAADRQLLLVFEDLHWADPSTLELLDRLVERIESLPALIVSTARPGFTASWTDQAHVTLLTLNRIGKRESRALFEAMAGEDSAPDDVIEEITIRSDGVPLFVEEISRAVLETRRLDGAPALGSSGLEVPASLQDSLTARLDRLSLGKPVAQMAAAVGRDFTLELLAPVCDLPRPQLDRALDELVDAGVLNRRGASSDHAYAFKHALVQDAAYQGLLHANRRQLHQRIAEALGTHLADQPALLAHHWECAADLDQALKCRLQAGQRAAKRFALWEAAAQYWHALDLLQRLPETEATRNCHVETLLAVCDLGVFWRNEAEQDLALQHVDKAMALASERGTMANLARLEAFKGNHWQDEPTLVQAMRHAATVGDARLNAYVANLYAAYFGKIGQFETSHAHVERAIQTYADLGAEIELGLTMAITGRCYHARAGNIERSLLFARHARKIADATDHPRLRSWLAMEAEPYMYRGLWERTVEVVERDLPFALEIGNWGVVLFASAWATIAYVELGRLGEARTMIERAMTISARRTVYEHYKIYPEIALARLHLASADTESALAAGQSALARANCMEHRLEEGAAHRVLGQIHEVADDRPEAEAQFRRSLEVLGAIQSRPELAQSLLAYGRFRLAHDPDEGCRLLGEALALFEDMDATGWIEETRAALDGNPDGNIALR